MRKKSKYKPKHVLANPLAYVLESISPVASQKGYLLSLKVRNHAAMTQLTTGVATRDDIEALIAMANMTEALSRLGFGEDYNAETIAGLDALHDVASRGVETSKFILRAPEMAALNTLIELHDAQLDVITVKDMENALAIVDAEFRHKRMRKIVGETT